MKMTKCNVCGYDDKGTGDRAHVCNAPAKHMSEQSRVAFEKFFPRPLVFKNKAHELEMISKWNDAKINWETSLEAATAEANKRVEALESEVAELKEKVANYDRWLSGGVYYTNDESFKLHNDYNNKISELQASNNDLREALGASDDLLRKLPNSGGFYGLAIMENNQLVLSATPAESLQAFENSVIEKCAKVCEDDAQQSRLFGEPMQSNVAEAIAESLRALKQEVK